MNITLKKAADLARAAGEAAEKIKIEPTLRHSIHAEMPDVAAAATKIEGAVANYLSLVEAKFTLRGLIGEANAKSGIDALLTEREMVDAQIKRLGALVESFDEAIGNNNTPPVALAEAASIKDRLGKGERGFGYHESHVTMSIVTEQHVATITKRLGVLKRRRADITDKVAGLNLNTTVSLAPSTILVLKTAGIIE